MLRQYGYGVKQAKLTPDGFGGGYYLVDEEGKKAIKTPISKAQKVQEEVEQMQQKFSISKSQIDAYHGSSKKFDKFSTSKIGEGVGAQAQGWGLYFTDLKSVAKFYANNNNIYEVSLHEGKKPNEYTWLDWDERIEKNVRDRILEKFIQEKNISKDVLNKIIKATEEDIDGADLYDLFKELGITTQEGFAINALLRDKYSSSGLVIYDSLKKAFGNIDSNASEFLLRANVDGVKYQNVYEDGNGFNYVVFDENAVTIKNISKAQKNAVDTVNKIVKDARAQGFSEESIKMFLEEEGFAQTDITNAMAPETPASARVKISEKLSAGFDRMMGEVDGIIEKSKKRNVDQDKITENVINYVMGSKVYENATDVQREKIIRDIKTKFGINLKSAPSVAKLFGTLKDVKKFTLTEKQFYYKQIC
jgi:hypothetical protein